MRSDMGELTKRIASSMSSSHLAPVCGSFVPVTRQTSAVKGLPVRVVRGYKLKSVYAPYAGYRYDGLYRVEKVSNIVMVVLFPSFVSVHQKTNVHVDVHAPSRTASDVRLLPPNSY